MLVMFRAIAPAALAVLLALSAAGCGPKEDEFDGRGVAQPAVPADEARYRPAPRNPAPVRDAADSAADSAARGLATTRNVLDVLTDSARMTLELLRMVAVR